MHINILASASEYSLTNLDIGEAQTVEDLRQCVLQHLALPTPPRSVRLLHNGCLMQAERLLSEYQIEEGSTVHMVLRPGTVTAAAPPSAPAQDSRNATSGTADASRSTAQTAASQFAHNIQNIIASALPNGNIQTIIEAVVNSALQQAPQTAAAVTTTQPPPAPPTAAPNRPTATVQVSTAPPPHGAAGQVATVAHIHLHCTLQELDQVPGRLAQLRQRMGASNQFHVDTDNFDIRVSAGAQQELQQPASEPVTTQPPTAPRDTPSFPSSTLPMPEPCRIRACLRQCLAEAYVGPELNTRFADKLLDDILHDEPLRRTCRMSLDMVVHEMRNFARHMLPIMRPLMENEAASDAEWGRNFMPVGLHAVALVLDRANHWFQHGGDDLLDFLIRTQNITSNTNGFFHDRRDISVSEMSTLLRTMIAFYNAATPREGDEGIFFDEAAEASQLDDLANELLGEP